MPKPAKNHYLAVTTLGKDKPYVINQVTDAIASTGCNVHECRVTALGQLWAGHFFISGHWNEIAKAETLLPKVSKQYELSTNIKRTDNPLDPNKNCLPYAIYVVALDEAGTIAQITNFFSEQDIHILELNCHTYIARQTQARMLSLNMVISIPEDVHIADIRDRFTEFCDDLNFDAIIEPEKY